MQKKDPSSDQTYSSLLSASYGSSSKSSDFKVKFFNATNSNVSDAPDPEVDSKYITFTSVNFCEKLGRLAAQKKAIKISADQRKNSSPVQTSDSLSSSHLPPYKFFEDNYFYTSNSGKLTLPSKVSPVYAHTKPIKSYEKLSRFLTMKRSINDFSGQTKADGKKPMQKQMSSNVQNPKPTIQNDPQPSKSKIQALDSLDTLPFAGLVPSKFKTQHQNYPSTAKAADSTSFLFEKQANAIFGSVESSDSSSSSSRIRPVYTPGTLRASQLLSSSLSSNSRPRYTPGSLRLPGSPSSSTNLKAPYFPGILRSGVTETLFNNAANAKDFQGIRGPFITRTLADGIAERASACTHATVSNRIADEVTVFVDSSASNSNGDSTTQLDAAQFFLNTLKPMEPHYSNMSPKDQTFAAVMHVASSLDNADFSAQVFDETSNSNNGFESVDLLITTTEPVNYVNLDSILLDDQLLVSTATAYANNNSFEQIGFATTVSSFTVKTDTVANFNLATRNVISNSLEQVESATANVACANDPTSASASASIVTHSEDLISFSPNSHDHTYSNINYNIGLSNITIAADTAVADFQSGTSTSNNIGSVVLKEETKKEAQYASKIVAVFSFTTTKDHYEVVSHGQYVPPPDFGTPVYDTAYNAINQTTTTDVSNSGSDKTGSTLLFIDTDRLPSSSESVHDNERSVSDLLICQPAELKEYYLPRGLVSLQQPKSFN